MGYQPPIGSDGELDEARRRMFPDTSWSVAEDYQLDGTLVRPIHRGEFVPGDHVPAALRRESCNVTYHPMGRTELPAELAKVADEREDSLLAFVRRYGLLGQLQGFRIAPPEVFSWQSVQHDIKKTRLGDEAAWIIAHARGVRLVMELSHALSNPDHLPLAISKITDSDGHLRFAFAAGGFMGRHGRPNPNEPKVGTTLQELQSEAQLVIWSIMSPNLRAVYPEISASKGRLVRYFRSESLIGSIYWLLADAAVSGTIRECAYERCRRLFTATDDRMKYCPPPLGNEGVSPCMNRSKVASARARAKKAGRKAKQRGVGR